MSVLLRSLGLMGALVFWVVGSVQAEDLAFVDGPMWKASAGPVKRAYLIGIGNYLNVEYAYQKKYGPPKDDQTTAQRMYEGFEDLTLDQVTERIDKWYKANPSKLDTAVLEVIWIDMVEPNLPAERQYE